MNKFNTIINLINLHDLVNRSVKVVVIDWTSVLRDLIL